MAVAYALLNVPFVLFNQDYSGLFLNEDKEISEWKDTSDAKILQADIAGLNKDNINVEIKKYKVLTISGSKKENINGKTVETFFAEEIPIPEDVRDKDMTAQLDNGVLMIKAPKSSPKPLRKPLPIAN